MEVGRMVSVFSPMFHAIPSMSIQIQIRFQHGMSIHANDFTNEPNVFFMVVAYLIHKMGTTVFIMCFTQLRLYRTWKKWTNFPQDIIGQFMNG